MSIERKFERAKPSLLRKGQFPTHQLIAKTAHEMALCTWECWAKANNQFYADNREAKLWAREAWPLFVEKARATLAEMLGRDTPEVLKEQIFHALIADNALKARRDAAKVLQVL